MIVANMEDVGDIRPKTYNYDGETITYEEHEKRIGENQEQCEEER